jgi:hypothetical protein
MGERLGEGFESDRLGEEAVRAGGEAALTLASRAWAVSAMMATRPGALLS